MAEVIIQRAPAGSDVYCYDSSTDAPEVNGTLHALVRQYGMTRNIWVIAGVRGKADGTVSLDAVMPDFQAEDVDTANRVSTQIHVESYHLLSHNTWTELREQPGATNVLVLAFGYSQQWFQSDASGGNDGKL